MLLKSFGLYIKWKCPITKNKFYIFFMGCNQVLIIKALIYPFKIFVLLLSSLIEACPPYRYAEGLLESKEVLKDPNRFLIHVSSAIIEVDNHTFSNLMIGENIRVRSTRNGKAISIDRLIPKEGPV